MKKSENDISRFLIDNFNTIILQGELEHSLDKVEVKSSTKKMKI